MESPLVLFEDTHVLVVSKPAGLLSQGEKSGDPNLVDWAREYLGRHYVGLVHRLDRNTSGIMILAKRSKSAQRLTEALQSGEVARSYLAWLDGELREPARWRHFLLKDEKHNRSRVVAQGTRDAKEAVLAIRPVTKAVSEGRPATLAEFVLETGRSHQIRAQAAHEKHPLLGDAKYHGPASTLISRPALHSYHLRFPHPMSKDILAFSAPLPDDFTRIGGSSLSDIDQLLMKCGSEMFGKLDLPDDLELAAFFARRGVDLVIELLASHVRRVDRRRENPARSEDVEGKLVQALEVFRGREVAFLGSRKRRRIENHAIELTLLLRKFSDPLKVITENKIAPILIQAVAAPSSLAPIRSWASKDPAS